MIKISEECTGCMACMNRCPTGAIHQTLNEYGYIFPALEERLCIDCGLCEEVCPLIPQKNNIHGGERHDRPVNAYAMYHKSEEVVKKSSSGGVFYALASQVLSRGGIVFGCYYDVNKKRAHLTDTDHVPLDSLLTSKYVESYIGYGYRRVKKQLDNGRKVLFCGTPCQAAGLAEYLGELPDNLLLVDFTCGAVSSQKYLRDYLKDLEKRFRSKLVGFHFRDKHYGWGQYCLTAEFKNGKLYRKTAMSDPYFFCFLRSSMQRLCCQGCIFSDGHYSDVIISDFWKCDYFDIDRNGRRGISLVLVMTEKGKAAAEEIESVMNTQELDIEEASYNLRSRSCPPEKLPEIFDHQKCASQCGVRILRKRITTRRRRAFFALRQFVMDHPFLAGRFPGIVGDGQIMRQQTGGKNDE